MKFIKKFIIAIALFSVIKILAVLFLPARSSYASDFTPPSPISTSSRISNSEVSSQYFSSIDTEVAKFLKKRQIVGASIAVSKDGKLVMAKGYGYADKESLIPVEPFNLFRIASVSKLITAVGVMKLCETGKLSIDTKVFGPNGILKDSIFLTYKDKRFEDITVGQLLNHSGGWNNRYGDPAFMPAYIASQLNIPLPITDTDIIRFMMTKRLHFTPGTSSTYSNFGYQILGRVIEEVSNTSYEEYIKTNILFPIGIFDMKLGHSYLEEREPLEVKYYETSGLDLVADYQDPTKMVARCYGGNDIRTLGSAGGWIASSTDLLKLTLAIDGNPSPSDILSSESISKMVTPVAEHFSPYGWRGVTPNGTWYRTGTLSGSSVMITHRPDGISYVFVVNTSTYKGPDLAYELQRVAERGLLGITEWPAVDLFELDKSFTTPMKMSDIQAINEKYPASSEDLFY